MSSHEAEQPSAQPDAGPTSVAILDQSLWVQFNKADNAEDFVQAWLGLQCRHVPGAQAAAVVLGDPDTGPFSPVAIWPPKQDIAPDLIAAANECITKKQSIVITSAPQASTGTIAVPVTVDGRLYGTVALSLICGSVNHRAGGVC